MKEAGLSLYSAEQVRELDRRAIEQYGIAGFTLMQRAAQACWSQIRERWPQVHVLGVVCGRGNNGGDGYEIARLARAEGRQVWVVAPYGVPERGDARRAYEAWRAAGGGEPAPFTSALPPCAVLVDALFGTGLARGLDDQARTLVAAIDTLRRSGSRVVAVDTPSGLDAGSGAVHGGSCVQADLTVSFIGGKLGLHTGEGPRFAGEVCYELLDLPAELAASMTPLAMLQDRTQLTAALPRRARTAHKGDHGHVVVIGGNRGMAGAALLAARAALRAGAGLVSVVTRTEHTAALTAAQAELMCHGADDHGAVRALLRRADVVALGPGLGTDDWARSLWAMALDAAVPLVLDADALNLLALEPTAVADAVLTPHPGEAGRLLGWRTAEVQGDRLAALHELEQRYAAHVVLKGAGTLVSGAPPQVCPFGNPGMGVGGMGDTLTGIIAALRAQGLSGLAAAQTGVLAHALAGDAAARGGERGLLPSDLIDALRGIVNP